MVGDRVTFVWQSGGGKEELEAAAEMTMVDAVVVVEAPAAKREG